MVELLFLIILRWPFLHNSGYYWEYLFIGLAFFRFWTNINKTLFVLSMLSLLLWTYFSRTFFFNPMDLLDLMLFAQTALCALSFTFNTYKKHWKYNMGYYWLEILLVFVFLKFTIISNNPLDLMFFLNKWIVLFIGLQIIYLLWRFSGAWRLPSLVAEGERTVPKSPSQRFFESVKMEFEEMIAKLQMPYKEFAKLAKRNRKIRDREKSDDDSFSQPN